jgi:hypothetical protein
MSMASLARRRRPLSPPIDDEAGAALVVTLLAVTFLMALGTALVMTTMAEGKISGNYRDGVEALYAADAALERTVGELAAADWNALLSGTVRSAFVDGPPAGPRSLDGAVSLDLTEATNMLRCGRASSCSEAAMDATSGERPHGRNNPRWQPYAYGPLTDLMPGGRINSRIYIVVWVGDDTAEDDDRPMRDGDPAVPGGLAPNPGAGLIAVLARSYGPDGSGRTVRATVARAGTRAKVVSWRAME